MRSILFLKRSTRFRNEQSASHKSRRKNLRKHLQKRAAAHLTAQYDTTRLVNAVHLKNALCQVNANRGQLHHGLLLVSPDQAPAKMPDPRDESIPLMPLAENAVSRFKALVGDSLASRTFERQQIEALVKSQVLNRMAALGMPRSEHISVG